jgi:hypothetical protein
VNVCVQGLKLAVSWHKQFVSGSMFTTRPVSVGFLVHKVALGQVLLCTLQSSPVRIISSTLHIRVSLMYNWQYTILAMDNVLKKTLQNLNLFIHQKMSGESCREKWNTFCMHYVEHWMSQFARQLTIHHQPLFTTQSCLECIMWQFKFTNPPS